MAEVEVAEWVEMLIPLAVGVYSSWLRNFPQWDCATPAWWQTWACCPISCQSYLLSTCLENEPDPSYL